MTHPRFLRIELAGDLALGGYFLMAHWPDAETAPELESAEGPLTLVFDTHGRSLSDLGKTILSVHPRNDALAESARAWREELRRRGIIADPSEGAAPTGPSKAPHAG